MRDYARQLSANQARQAPSPEMIRQQQLSRKDLEKFQKDIRLSPTSVCCTCERLCYPKGVSLVDVSKVHDVLQQHYHACINDTQLSALLPNEEVNGSVHVCSRCMAFIKKGKIPPFATINNMHVDKIPLELSRLNTMEQRLISRVQASMKLIVLPLGQRALAGQTINFPANVSEVFNSLPRPLNSDGVKPPESTSAIPTSDQTASTSSGPHSARASTSTNSACANTAQSTCSSTSTRNLYVVRKPLVVDALRWLRENNPLYSNVNIDESVIDSNDCSDITNEPQQSSIEPPQFECSVVRTDHTLPNLEAIDFIRNGSYNNQVQQLPRVSGQPINLYEDNSAEEMAFPCLFPNGVNGLHTARDPPILFTDYIQSRLLNVDNRWSSNIPYLLWSANLLEKMRLRDSVSIAMRIRSSSSLGSTGSITAGELLNGDLFAMFRTLGPPTFFITLSADDMNWFDLMCVLAKCDGKNLSDDELSTSERRRLLSSYPVIVAHHFSHRFQAFMNHILNGASKPIGQIKDYFWRVEFQQRGSPHIHSLWWVEDAPDIKTVEGRRKAPGFIDKYVSCHVPRDGEDDLKDLVLRLQKHNHTQTCRKNGRNRCRFDYPKRPSDTTRLKRNADVGNKARFYILKREVGAEMINPYNPDLLKAWRANMDIQVVGNVYGAAKYVCHYMCKDEPEQIKQQIARKLDELPENCSQRQKL